SLELESSADVDRFAVAMIIGQRRDLVALDLVTDATGYRDVAADIVGAADVNRVAVGPRQLQNAAVVPLAANCHAAGKFLEVIAHANHGGFTGTYNRIWAAGAGYVAGDGQTLPAYRQAKIILSGAQVADRRSHGNVD